MSFYCVYCNLDRSGRKGTPEERTKEHFIPKSIGGCWTVPACKECNHKLGSTSDPFLKDVAYTYSLYRNGIVEVDGLAELHNGKKVEARFKYQITKGGHDQFYWCRDLRSRDCIQEREIRALMFPVQRKQAVANSYPSIAKMALAGCRYLVGRSGQWVSHVRRSFFDLRFADLRACFLGKDFRPGGRGDGHGVLILSIIHTEAAELLRNRSKPEIRRHYLSADDVGLDLSITLCLYSEYFWRVTVPRAAMGIGKLEDETLLANLDAVNLLGVANLQHKEDGTWIKVLLRKRA